MKLENPALDWGPKWDDEPKEGEVRKGEEPNWASAVRGSKARIGVFMI